MIWVYRIIFVAVILISIQAFFFKKIGLKSVSCKRWFSSRYVFEGEDIYLTEEITNERPAPVPLLVIESRINKNIELSSAVELNANDSNYHRSIFSLLPFSKIVRRHKIKIVRRGYYNLKSIAVSSYDLLGISKLSVNEMPVNAVVTVYPALLDVKDILLPCHSFLGDMVVRRWIMEDPFLNAGIRSYMPTDPLKSINWKASARTGSLQVNKHDFSANTRLLVLFNVDLSEHEWGGFVESASLEYALSLCATIIKSAIENNMEVAFMSNGFNSLDKGSISHVESGSGEQHLYAILEALALLSFNHACSFHYLLSQLYRTGIHETDILIITPYIDKEIEEQIELLRYAANAVEFMMPDGGEAA